MISNFPGSLYFSLLQVWITYHGWDIILRTLKPCKVYSFQVTLYSIEKLFQAWVSWTWWCAGKKLIWNAGGALGVSKLSEAPSIPQLHPDFRATQESLLDTQTSVCAPVPRSIMPEQDLGTWNMAVLVTFPACSHLQHCCCQYVVHSSRQVLCTVWETSQSCDCSLEADCFISEVTDLMAVAFK